MAVKEFFGCCSLHLECVEEGRCVAGRNPYITPEEAKEYPKYCALAARLTRDIAPPVPVNKTAVEPEMPLGRQLSLF